ncbi:MAG: hypothetical protein AUJ52_02350 [Elusimicrobia bacterium CG1_02_63_36]|nr:MAG: hypothetical protein AUJ52_02350 [Elusimicrobia bacterium CG1_02_63_36]PIP84080.1 MAG: hypothetical protein COR54_06070 [Elusimicrobia bacterium CG22_combo_CG10-13_8_21_14_all_63_91]PJA15089.1 MAG: hypothetical protein COX66_10955 [Elusimicrobia bacterium CG_4_10_14_0_2_um_filter_63_34]PJB23497.1 MAG: hypothetical protein CO113_17945 [Elusimicrobia bacterium CG_4_9_14_3_um_filter_62_55]
MNAKIFLSMLTATAMLSAPVGATQDAAPKSWTTLSGSVSGVSQWRTVDVRDAGTWKALWAEHNAHRTDAPSAPFVDFERERVIAVFFGMRSSGGRAVSLDLKENKDAGVLEVSVRENAPAKGGFAITMMSQPFVFRRASKEIEKVVFPQAPGARSPGSSPVAPAASVKLAERKTSTAVKVVAGLGERLEDLRDSVASLNAAYDGGSAKSAVVSGAAPVVLTGGKPLPGQQEDQGKPLPGRKKDSGKPLPGQGGQNGKPLPGNGRGKPLPGDPREGGKPLPGQGAVRHPRPIYPGGPLPSNDPRLEGADRAFTTYGMDYVGYWNGKTFYSTSRGTLERNGKNAGSRYSLSLASRQMRNRYLFYYDPADRAYYYVPDEEPLGNRVGRDLTIQFLNASQSPLMPWESERFVFELTGSQLTLVSQNGAYRYTGTFSSFATDPSQVIVELTAGQKLLTAPDAQAVTAGIQATATGLKLIINDRWAAEYAGETLEISAVVRWDDGSFWRRDPVVFQATGNAPLSFTAAKTLEHEFAVSKTGKYYLESWAFRRANSKISTSHWINRGQGNSVKR